MLGRKKKAESKLNAGKIRMLRWARGKTRLDHIRKEDIRKEADVKPVEIGATRSFWEKEQRSTEKEMEGQHTGRLEEIPTD